MSSFCLNNDSALKQDDLETSPSLVALAKLWLHSTLCMVSIISARSPCIAGLNSTSFSPEVLSCSLEVEHKVLWEFPDLACESNWITPVPPTWNSLLQNLHLPRYLFEPGFRYGRDDSHCLQYLVFCLGIVN